MKKKELLKIIEKYKCCGNCGHPDLSDDFCFYANTRVYKQHVCGNWRHFRDMLDKNGDIIKSKPPCKDCSLDGQYRCEACKEANYAGFNNKEWYK